MERWQRLATIGAVFGLVVSLAQPASSEEAEPEPTLLQRVVDRLGEEASAFDRGAILGITVVRLDTGERADFQGDRWLKSASSLKPTWVVAAVMRSGIEAVEPYADQVWARSSNKAGGRVIGLAGGLDNVNALTGALGMHNTLVVEWTPGGEWLSSDYPGPHPALNCTSTDDLVRFWELLYRGWILGYHQTQTILEWSRLPRLQGYSSGLLTRLPEEQAPHVAYKMGWLPPGRTEEDEETGEVVEVDALDTLVGSGVSRSPAGRPMQ